MYNYIFIVGRTVFWDLQNLYPVGWMFFDYLCDVIYVLDMVVHAHEGLLRQSSHVIMFFTILFSYYVRRLFGARASSNRTG